MAAFNLNQIRSNLADLIPQNFTRDRLPSWPAYHSSMNPDSDDVPVTSPSAKARTMSSAPIQEIIAEPPPIKSGPKSNLDLIDECDSFPYFQKDPKAFFAHIKSYYGLFVADYPDTELGYVLPSVARVFHDLPDWNLDTENRTLTLLTGSNEEERSRAVAITTQAMRAMGIFKVLKGWRDELYPVYGDGGELLFSVERAASALFGVVSYGCHMTAYTRSRRNGKAPVGGDGAAAGTISEEEEQLRLWIPRRAATKQTYAGMLDNTVAGGIATGEHPLESMVRESREEASLPEDLVRRHARSVGTVTYFHVRDHRAGGETCLLQPECQYVYDLELPEDVIPRPSEDDDEVEGFELMSIGEVKVALRDGEFKPNCVLVLLDFFVRHGIIPAGEEGYVEIVSRLHRRLEFPTL